MAASQRREYWRRTLFLTLGLLAVWVAVTYITSWHARELNEIVIFGFPLGFYMGAQGSLLVYLAIVGIYCRLMVRLDAKYRIDDYSN